MTSATEKNKSKAEQQEDLTDALEDSFPASDPPSMTQPKTHAGAPGDKKSSSSGTEAELERQQKAADKK
ncbi:MAG: hypothetical protein JWL93_1160 [Hyphomicrobiales bacterium]|jgi:hypothetical protein|nr:hypothetical protein [Hyphomicrobiales bacterium]